jgi:hypothetical protein
MSGDCDPPPAFTRAIWRKWIAAVIREAESRGYLMGLRQAEVKEISDGEESEAASGN